ncbi:MAG: electron transfer flavoprotein subunit alpha/FixB family protein [Kofleriaceae bacterium]|nr:electron transfer flavoprotein subunit alpha/FixB family protein [Kofleriaceae bacterium]MCB9571046.1 electron transfer flavoprotein subunit alpha/FixB family protein [Kofleriaceae bacterium]
MACVLVHIEADGDQPTPASREALGEGRRIASTSGATLYAMIAVAGSGGDPRRPTRAETLPPYAAQAAAGATHAALVEAVGAGGADKIVFVNVDGDTRPALWATVGPALAAACQHLRPVLVLLPASAGSDDIGARLAARLGAAYVHQPVIEQGPRGEVVLSRPVYGGGWRRRLSLDDPDRAVVVALAPGRRPARGSDEAEVLLLDVRAERDPRVSLVDATAAEGAPLARARVIVTGGGGVTAASWPLLVELAAALGGEVGATRALCQRGVAPAAREIGVGAQRVAPHLYVVCGASGSAAHLGAVSAEAEIVAIDRDADAPILKRASYGVVGRIEDVVPRMLAALRPGAPS